MRTGEPLVKTKLKRIDRFITSNWYRDTLYGVNIGIHINFPSCCIFKDKFICQRELGEFLINMSNVFSRTERGVRHYLLFGRF